MKSGDLSKKYVKAISIECSNQKIAIGDLEKGVGLSPGYLSRCKKGKKRMSIDSIETISKFLKVDFIEKIHFKEDRNEQQAN